MITADDLKGRALEAFAPPENLILSQWAEANIILPTAARAGRYRNWPYLREILDTIGDRHTERVTVMKAARVGYTTALMVAVGASAERNPAPIGLLVPRDDDARRYAVQDLEPIFEASPALTGLLKKGRQDGRNTLLRKNFLGGGRLTILPTRSAGNLRGHDFKFLFCDEVDAWEMTTDGDPLKLAEDRTRAHADRKIVIGSTPLEEGISIVEREYLASDRRVYEIPCPHCSGFFELKWEHIQWPDPDGMLGHSGLGDTTKTAAYCPGCGGEIEERLKVHLVEDGRWRPQRPEITGHRGYKLPALISLLPKASWAILAAEYIAARKGGPAEMQVFQNNVLAQTWRTTLNAVDAQVLMSRTEDFGLDRIPEWVLATTVGADVQNDRIEATVLGWGRPISTANPGPPTILGHVVIDGSTLEDGTWADFDRFLRSRWKHPNGWELKVDACCVDSGGGEGRTQKVYDFCEHRSARRIFPIAGRPGARPIVKRAEKVKGSSRLFIVGHDQVKTSILEMLGHHLRDEEGRLNPYAVRISEDLDESWFDQATGETRRIKYVRNRAVIEFMPRKSGQRVEALDCLCYGLAARHLPAFRIVDFKERAERKPDPTADKPKKAPGDWAEMFNSA